jgi:3'-phosphoadenosine 5'-phosphosulfate sulfotransferase (PAPS reductase)/FAD synthetase
MQPMIVSNIATMKSFISFSGGVESRTMAVLFGNKADAIFADTGAEHDELYKQLDHVEAKIREFHNNDFKIIRVKQKSAEGTGIDNLLDYIKYTKFFPGFGARYCTRIFKIEPIDDFLAQFDEVQIMIGLNADEADLRTGNHGLLAHVQYDYPLIEHGVNRRMCHEILAAAGITPNFPPYMRRGGCKCCYFKSKKEFEAMAILNEKEYDEVAALEQEIQDKRDKFFRLITNIPNLRDFKVKAQSILFRPDEIYATVNDATNCGVFCNR